MADLQSKFTPEGVSLVEAAFLKRGTVHYDLEQIAVEGHFQGPNDVKQTCPGYFDYDQDSRIAAVRSTPLNALIEGAHDPENKLAFAVWRLGHRDPSSEVRAACLDVVIKALQSPDAKGDAKSALLGELVHFVCKDPVREIKASAASTFTHNKGHLLEPCELRLDADHYFPIASAAQGLSGGLVRDIGHIVDKHARRNVVGLVGEALRLGTDEIATVSKSLLASNHETRVAELEKIMAPLEINLRQLLRSGSDFQEQDTKTRVALVHALACRLPKDSIVTSFADSLNRGNYDFDKAVIGVASNYLDKVSRSREPLMVTEAWGSLAKQLQFSVNLSPRLKAEASDLLEKILAAAPGQADERVAS